VLRAAVVGNSFTDTSLRADFWFEHRTVAVDGFYDGDGTWRVRFMPDEIGEWSYITHSSTTALNGKVQMRQTYCRKPRTRRG
jgi:hypothetical protein